MENDGERLLLRNCAIIVQWSVKDKGTQEEYWFSCKLFVFVLSNDINFDKKLIVNISFCVWISAFLGTIWWLFWVRSMRRPSEASTNERCSPLSLQEIFLRDRNCKKFAPTTNAWNWQRLWTNCRRWWVSRAMDSQKPAPDIVLQSFSCSCKKSSCKTRVCSCSSNGLQCT